MTKNIIHIKNTLWVWFFLFLTRSFDLYSTYLSTPDLATETNVLVQFLSLGWNSLFVSNILFLLLSLPPIYYYINEVRNYPDRKINSLCAFVSMSLYGTEDECHKFLHKKPLNNQLQKLWASFLFISLILFYGTFAGCNNLLIYFDVQIYCSFLRIYGKYVFYFMPLIFMGVLTYLFAVIEYHKFKHYMSLK